MSNRQFPPEHTPRTGDTRTADRLIAWRVVHDILAGHQTQRGREAIARLAGFHPSTTRGEHVIEEFARIVCLAGRHSRGFKCGNPNGRRRKTAGPSDT